MKQVDLHARVILQIKDDIPKELVGNLVLAVEQCFNKLSFDAKVKEREFETVVFPRVHFINPCHQKQECCDEE